MLRHDQIKQCVVEIRQAIETGNEQKKELERQLTEVMVQIRDLQAGLRLAAELSQISLTEEQEREAQVKAIQEKAAAVISGCAGHVGHSGCPVGEMGDEGTPGLNDPGLGDYLGQQGQPAPAEAACDEPCEALMGTAD